MKRSIVIVFIVLSLPCFPSDIHWRQFCCECPITTGQREYTGSFQVQALSPVAAEYLEPIESGARIKTIEAGRRLTTGALRSEMSETDRPPSTDGPSADAPGDDSGILSLAPSKVFEYYKRIEGSIRFHKEDIRKQILRFDLHLLRHKPEYLVDLRDHVIIGQNGFVLHSHINESLNGTLIKVERSLTGDWEPREVLMEFNDVAGINRYRRSDYFFSVNTLTKSVARRQALLSTAKPFVKLFQALLDEPRLNEDEPYAMGQGITPGTEEAHVIGPVELWDSATGIWVDPSNGWAFLRSDWNLANVTAADLAISLIRYWTTTVNRPSNLFHVNVPDLPERMDRHDLQTLNSWADSLAYGIVEHRRARLPDPTGLYEGDLAFILFLIRHGSVPLSTIRGARSRNSNAGLKSLRRSA
jgi:hypothetical protein